MQIAIPYEDKDRKRTTYTIYYTNWVIFYPMFYCEIHILKYLRYDELFDETKIVFMV